MEAYITVAQAATVEFTEKKSRFIGHIVSVQKEEEATAFLAEIRSNHWDATHNCYAYILKNNIQRYGDDGEPKGTAGIPIIEVLRREHIVDAIVVVTRYFGGILLGAGGLVRAYSNAASLALKAAGTIIIQPCTVFFVEVSYNLYERVNSLLRDCGAAVLQSDFGARVKLKLRIPSSEYMLLRDKITEITSGIAIPVVLYEELA